jgi:hypothetical protein
MFPTPGFVWVYLAIFLCGVVAGLGMVAYETVATVSPSALSIGSD